MKFKEYLQNIIKEKEKRAADLRTQIDASKDKAEVRALGETLQSVLDELSDAKDQLKEEEENDDGDGDGEGGDGTGTGDGASASAEGDGQQRSQFSGGFNPLASYTQTPQNQSTPENRTTSVYGTIEYREAFAQYVRTGNRDRVAEVLTRADETLITDDIGVIIPETIMQEYIRQLSVYGHLYSRTRKLSIRGGVNFPIEEKDAVVSWINEEDTSETQAAPNYKNYVTFGYHIVEARIAQSMLSQIVSLPVLEQRMAQILVEAFMRAFDYVIVNGSGIGQPLGILNDDRVLDSNKIDFTDAEIKDWTEYRRKFFSKIPLAYQPGGIMLMTTNTWEAEIMTLRDDNNRPLATEVYEAGTSDAKGGVVRKFAGREILLVEPDILKDYSTADDGDAFAIYLQPQEYAINSQMQIGFKRYFNDDTNKWVNKGITIIDGKLLDTNGVYILRKKVAGA